MESRKDDHGLPFTEKDEDPCYICRRYGDNLEMIGSEIVSVCDDCPLCEVNDD